MSPVTAQRRIPSGKAAALRRVAPAAARVSKITPVYSPLIQRKPACACGGVCPKCRSQENLQPKLKIGAPDDKYEREADRVADRIMRQPLSEKEEEETVQAKAVPGQETGSSIAIPDGFLAGGGRLLPPSTKHFLESRLGHDFSHVRIHDGAPAAEAAQSINARAFTLGRDVVFNKGEYSPDSERGKRLLAHELTHVMQQAGGGRLPHIQRQEEEESTEDVRIYFNAFIPGSLGTWLDEPGTPHCEFKTDERDFGEVGTSRISQYGSFVVSSGGISGCSSRSVIGRSHRRCWGYVPPTLSFSHRRGGLELDTGGFRQQYASDTAADHGTTTSNCSGNSANFHFIGRAAYPFLPGPNIDFDVHITITQSGNNFSVEVQGERNEFPAYEVVVVRGGTRTVIYRYMPSDSGPGLINLNTSSDFTVAPVSFTF